MRTHSFKILLSTILVCLSWFPNFAQQPLKWRVGTNGEIDFTGITGTPILSNDSLYTTYVNVPFYDQQGNMKFFSNGIAVMDQNMDTLQNGELYYNPSFTFPESGSNVINGTLILPRPDYPDQFYIFHSSYTEPVPPAIIAYGDLYYSIIDMSLNGGAGAISNVKNVFLKDSLWTGNINAVRHGNGRDWWLITGKNLSDTIYTWLVTKDSIFGPYGQAKGWAFSTSGNVVWQTAFNETGSKFAIAYAYQTGNIKRLLLTDFNRCTGELANGQLLTMTDIGTGVWQQGVSGVAFAKHGRFLYAGTGSSCYQFDLNTGNIQASRVKVGDHDHLPTPFSSGFSNMKLGPDGKVYCQTANGNYTIDVINYPDSIGLGCDVQLRQIDFYSLFGAGAINIAILPHYPNYWLGALTGSPCDTLVGVGVSNIEEIKLSVAPNPVKDFFTVSFPVQNHEGTLEVINSLGEIVIQTSVSPWSQFKKLNLRNFPTGLYFCKMKWKEKQAVVRVMKIEE
jgi:hypothetical protein